MDPQPQPQIQQESHPSSSLQQWLQTEGDLDDFIFFYSDSQDHCEK